MTLGDQRMTVKNERTKCILSAQAFRESFDGEPFRPTCDWPTCDREAVNYQFMGPQWCENSEHSCGVPLFTDKETGKLRWATKEDIEEWENK